MCPVDGELPLKAWQLDAYGQKGSYTPENRRNSRMSVEEGLKFYPQANMEVFRMRKNI